MSPQYIGTRTLYGLADQGQAPRFLLRVNRMGCPYMCTAVCSLVSCIWSVAFHLVLLRERRRSDQKLTFFRCSLSCLPSFRRLHSYSFLAVSSSSKQVFGYFVALVTLCKSAHPFGAVEGGS